MKLKYKSIKVAGNEYKVLEKPYVEIDNDLNYLGSCAYSKNELQIKEGLPYDRYNNVLIHELTHAIFYEAGFMEQDEDMIHRVANVLHQVIMDNFVKKESEYMCSGSGRTESNILP